METEKGFAFLVVGHSGWGKSMTLRALTDDNYKQRGASIDGITFFVRKMSNDDDRDGHPPFLDFAKALRSESKPYVIAAFCPTFGGGKNGAIILETLRKKYDLFYFVLKHSYDGTRQITEDEVEALGDAVAIKIFDRRAEASERGRALRQFVRENARVFQRV